jgi:hypothetical protein
MRTITVVYDDGDQTEISLIFCIKEGIFRHSDIFSDEKSHQTHELR